MFSYICFLSAQCEINSSVILRAFLFPPFSPPEAPQPAPSPAMHTACLPDHCPMLTEACTQTLFTGSWVSCSGRNNLETSTSLFTNKKWIYYNAHPCFAVFMACLWKGGSVECTKKKPDRDPSDVSDQRRKSVPTSFIWRQGGRGRGLPGLQGEPEPPRLLCGSMSTFMMRAVCSQAIWKATFCKQNNIFYCMGWGAIFVKESCSE